MDGPGKLILVPHITPSFITLNANKYFGLIFNNWYLQALEYQVKNIECHLRKA